ncbi:MAG: toll/interleukin-1 receptor domain-containing protein [Alphaproteobacteria bacterium]|nr:toll/interleukin-1 receptor domain-containing protein [Alphaproteobacteria bacterium]
MFGWLAGRYMDKETRRLLELVRRMPVGARRQVLAHVTDKMGLVNNARAKGGSEFHSAMKRVAEEAQRERQSAVSYGARSFSDPRWCGPALVETWAMAWLAMNQGRISRGRFDKIDASLWRSINEGLAPNEIIEAGHQSAPKLFLSYRREDSAGDARSIYGVLKGYFGDHNVFFDVQSISAGERFEDVLRRCLGESAVFIPIVGKQWLDELNSRLNDGAPDYVRMEVEAALERDVVIIPVLLSRDGRSPRVPRPDELPSAMRGLFAHQTHTVSHERFERDVADLAAVVRQQITERLSRQWMTTPKHARPIGGLASGGQERGTKKISALELAIRLNEALRRFVEIDEDIFKTSVGRAVGLSKIPFGGHQATLAAIERELAFLDAAAKHRDKREFLIAAIYAERLRSAVRSLAGICAGLDLKARGGDGPCWAEYNVMLEAYKDAKRSYSALGPDLNRFHRDARLLDARDRSDRHR